MDNVKPNSSVAPVIRKVSYDTIRASQHVTIRLSTRPNLIDQLMPNESWLRTPSFTIKRHILSILKETSAQRVSQ